VIKKMHCRTCHIIDHRGISGTGPNEWFDKVGYLIVGGLNANL
jgi:hypothetical protein